jgi:hypothetical protein
MTAEELLERYAAGERDFSHVKLREINLNTDGSLIFGGGSNIGINSNNEHAYNAEDGTG